VASKTAAIITFDAAEGIVALDIGKAQQILD
jgi:hypothetical protein